MKDMELIQKVLEMLLMGNNIMQVVLNGNLRIKKRNDNRKPDIEIGGMAN